jgi:K+-sensing histidine kinase KdpD
VSPRRTLPVAVALAAPPLAGAAAGARGLAAGCAVSAALAVLLLVRADHARARAEAAADEARLLYRLGVTPATDDPVADAASLAAVAAAELGATAVVVGVGKDVLHDGGLPAKEAATVLRTPPRGAAVATARLAGGDDVTVCALPGGFDAGRAALLDALAVRVASTVDRARLRTERRDRVIAEETERQRAALVSAVSHDLRTPLAAIKASASALSAAGTEPERAALQVSIGIEVDRLDRMVRNLLDLGRIESGRLVARPEPVPVDELVGSVLNRLRPRLRERRLELDVPAHLPPAMVDPVQGEQAIGNLVENVIAHTPMNAGLIVRAAARAEWLTIRIADEGPGIAEHERSRIFQRFARGSHAGPGSGLGLAIARAYAEANGGSLEFASSECGAAFDLRLPVAVES